IITINPDLISTFGVTSHHLYRIWKPAGFSLNQNKKFECFICGKKFKRSCQSSHGERPFKCEIATSHFKTNGALVRHQYIHSKEALVLHFLATPGKAEVSQQSFIQNPSGFEQSGLIALFFPCPMCDRTFSTTSQLCDHIRRHVRERPFPCHTVPRFCEANDRKIHEMINHDKRHLAKYPASMYTSGPMFERNGTTAIFAGRNWEPYLDKLNTTELMPTQKAFGVRFVKMVSTTIRASAITSGVTLESPHILAQVASKILETQSHSDSIFVPYASAGYVSGTFVKRKFVPFPG
ncbi:Zinc finger and BTB domain-containing protein 14, partial [Orchesella cincta]